MYFFGIILSTIADSQSTQSAQFIQYIPTSNVDKLIKLDVRNNRYYTKEYIALLLKDADLTSVISIKKTLGRTRHFYDIDVRIIESKKNTFIVQITVQEKLRINRVTLHGNTLISSEKLCGAVDLYFGAPSYDGDDWQKIQEKIIAHYRTRPSVNGFNIKYWWKNFCKTVDVSYNNTITDKGVELDLYIVERWDNMNMRMYVVYALCTVYFLSTMIYFTIGWKKVLGLK